VEIEFRLVGIVKSTAPLNRENKVKMPNKLALLMLPDVATELSFHIEAGGWHREDGLAGTGKPVPSPIALKFGV
jgi:hypothetical protein